MIIDILHTILLTKTTAAKNEVALSYDRVHGPMLCFLAVVFVAAIVTTALSSIWVMGNDGSCKCNSNRAMLNLAGLAL